MHIIGIDVGGTKILGILADEKGTILASLRDATGVAEGVDAVVARICRMIGKLTPAGGVDAVGLGMPGPLDAVNGVVNEPPNFPGWRGVPLRDMVRSGTGLPTDMPLVLINDASAAALGEYRFGVGAQYTGPQPLKHMVYLTISTGVGGGVIVDGALLLGATGLAGHLGHMVVDLHGPICGCGNRGCLEAMASGTALAREAAMLVRARRPTLMSELAEGDADKVTAEVVVEAARRGDQAASELMEREGQLIGAGVTSCIHIFNPQLVMLGGGLTNAGDLLFAPVLAVVDERVMPAYKGSFQIVRAGLGGESGAIGAVAAALESFEF